MKHISNVIMHYDFYICTHSKIITHCDITMGIYNNALIHYVIVCIGTLK